LSWVKIDDRYPWHKKLAQAGPAMRAFAMALDITGKCHAAQHRTDGFLDDAILDDLYVVLPRRKGPAVRDVLVRVGRWERDEQRGGYWIHDYLAYNPSAEEQVAEREQTAERVRRHRGKKRGSNSVTQQKGNAVTRNAGNAGVTPTKRPPLDPPSPGPGEGGAGGEKPVPPLPPHGPRRAAPPSAPPASPSSAVASGDADSAGETRSPPDLSSENPGTGDQPPAAGDPNGQVLPAEAKAELDRQLGPGWRRGPRAKAEETRAEFEAKREEFLTQLRAFPSEEPSETESSSDAP
jgi:hypothetical protein